jgi:hypothetical protein
MRKNLHGSFTLEASFIIPIILSIFIAVLYVLFYYHDKNVLLGTVHETAAYGAYMEMPDEDEVENYFISRIRGKMLLLTNVENEITDDGDEVVITCNASKSRMSLQVQCSVKRTNPEKYIRNIRKVKKLEKG